MRITVVSLDALPDVRIEKMMLSLKRLYSDAEILFLGPVRGRGALTSSSEDVYRHAGGLGERVRKFFVPIKLSLVPIPVIRRRMTRMLERMRPDLVVAVNLEAADLVHVYARRRRIPLLIDYHEIWSIQLKYIDTGYNLPFKFYYVTKRQLYMRLEERLLSKNVSIVVNENIKKNIIERTGNRDIYIVKNYPSLREIPRDIEELGCETIVLSYIGNGLLTRDKRLYRDSYPALRVLDDVYRRHGRIRIFIIGTRKRHGGYIEGVGYKPHLDMYKVFRKTHFGLHVSRPSESHKYNNPNRPYIYAAGGAVPIVTGDWESVVEDIGDVSLLVDPRGYPDSLRDVLEHILSMACEEINRMRRRAHRRILEKCYWESQDAEIKAAVEKAFSSA